MRLTRKHLALLQEMGVRRYRETAEEVELEFGFHVPATNGAAAPAESRPAPTVKRDLAELTTKPVDFDPDEVDEP